MQAMRSVLATCAAVVVGLGIGLIYGYNHAGAVQCLGTWGLVGLVFGAGATRWKPSVVSAAVFGFTVSLLFLVAGYQGAGPISAALPFFVLLGLFGAACGAVLGAIGWLARTRLQDRGSP
jgi:hypothetical protein